MRRKQLLSLVLILAISSSLILSGCGLKQKDYDESPITMYVGLGNTRSSYYEDLQKLIHDDLGIEVKLIYSSLLDTSNAVLSQIENNDLPADIVVTASRTPEEFQKNAFCNLSTISNIADKFTATELHRFSVGSSVYQIPLSSRLIGVVYNQTLMNEMGWSVPTNFEEMVQLKSLADEAGIKFAETSDSLTGHGFNYLFHLIGADYLSTINGNDWYNKFMSGASSVDSFEQAADYFKRYSEAGLFGCVHGSDWNAKTEFTRERALFYYNNINDISSYDGFQYTHDGKIYGAEYDNEGNIVSIPDQNGNAVLIDDEFVLYDENNESMKDLERYSIPGAVVLHDKYASMPWISENGTSNLYTIFNNMYLALDKKLLEEDQSHRLEKALKVLDYMTSDKATSLFSSLFADGYVPLKTYKADNSRMYYNYYDDISRGYTQPWYYNDFDTDSIVNVGDLVNKFIQGDTNINIPLIMDELEKRRDAKVNNTLESTSQIAKTMDYSESASVIAVAGSYSLSRALNEANISEKIDFSIVPYTSDISNIPVSVSIGVVQSKFYKGPFYPSIVNSYINSSQNTVYAIHMTGEELNSLLDAGFNTKLDHDYDFSYPYQKVQNGAGSIVSEDTYLVCVSPKSLSSDILEKFINDSKVIMRDGVPVEGTVVEGLLMYAEKNDTIDSDNLIWK